MPFHGLGLDPLGDDDDSESNSLVGIDPDLAKSFKAKMEVPVDSDVSKKSMRMTDEKIAKLPSELAGPVMKRNYLYETAQDLMRKFEGLTPKNSHMFKGRLQKLSQLETEFAQIQAEIVVLNLKLSKEDQVDVRSAQRQFDDIIDTAQCLYYSCESQPPSKTTKTITRHEDNPLCQVKLPPMNLPQFDGTPAKWPSFYSRFKVSVHDSSMSKIHKFSYLLDSLSEEPLSLIDTLVLDEKHYDVAWNLLCDKYRSEKRLVFSQFDGLLGLPEISKNSANLSQFSTKLQEHLHALEAMDISRKEFGVMLVSVILKKFSPALMIRFEDFRVENTKYPKLEEILKFLKSECSRLMDTPSSNSPATPIPDKSGSAQKSAKAYVAQPAQGSFDRFAKKDKANSGSQQSGSNQPPALAQKNSVSQPQQKVEYVKPCRFCSGPHSTMQCGELLPLDFESRKAKVMEKHRCWNCLSEGHFFKPTPKNPGCPSHRRCMVQGCGQAHHTLLHPPRVPPKNAAANIACVALQNVTTVLPTALVKLVAENGRHCVARVLCDSGASETFLSRKICQLLNLKPTPDVTSVSGLAQNSVPVDGTVEVTICTRDGKLVAEKHPMIVAPRLTGQIPSVPLAPEIGLMFGDCEVADPHFTSPGRIDALFGGDLFPKILTGATVYPQGRQGPIGIGTVFGFIVVGKAPAIAPSPQGTANVVALRAQVNRNEQKVNSLMEKFWKLENLPPPHPQLTSEELAAEEFFVKTTIQQESGKYMVGLPFKPDRPKLGASLPRALSRFYQLEKKFVKDPTFYEAYKEYMSDFENDGFMSERPFPKNDEECCFLPHHGVLKVNSSTTKLRPVLDGSAPTSNGVSLNDVLLSGPRLHADLSVILINFRAHPVVVSCDIKQMFLQIDVRPEDRKYQLIVWRPDPSAPLKCYEINCVTFGLTPSPFLSMRTVQKLIEDHGHKFPRGAAILAKWRFVDDLVFGGKSIFLVKADMLEVIELLKLAGFLVRKWTSSHPEILDDFPVEHLECSVLDDEENCRFSILGMTWVANQDSFTYEIRDFPPPPRKRDLLSQIASVFDPLGILAPVVVSAKILMQDVWRTKIGWNDALPSEIRQRWQEFATSLPDLKNLRVPRQLSTAESGACYQLHVFSDASEQAYAAAMYLRTHRESTPEAVETNFIVSKNRVAPLQTVTLPRLELCGAVLAVNLIEQYLPVIEAAYTLENIFCWTDSTITLDWISTPSRDLKTFVANRVSAIQTCDANLTWRFVPGDQNPADLATRGISALELCNSDLWWSGPKFLECDSSQWPCLPDTPTSSHSSADLELKPAIVANSVITRAAAKRQDPTPSPQSPLPASRAPLGSTSDDKLPDSFSQPSKNMSPQPLRTARRPSPKQLTAPLVHSPAAPNPATTDLIPNIAPPVSTAKPRDPLLTFPLFSSWDKNVSVFAWIYRFYQLTHFKMKISGPLKLNEIRAAERWILKDMQNESFSSDLKPLRKGEKEVGYASPLKKYVPFLDSNGILRVGGRLEHANVPFSVKHPVLLPSKHPRVALLVEKYHRIFLHPGPQLLQNIIFQKYWIVAPRSIMRKTVHCCIICFKAKPRNQAPLMGDLPDHRVNFYYPFLRTGTDFAGPFDTKIHLLRSARVVKSYLCIFLCLATRAVHLEIVCDLSTPAFVAALHRFVARRSSPSAIYSDCGSNYKGAASHFARWLDKNDPALLKFARDNEIVFHFNPPSAPHQGGIWEAAVKSAKHHLTRVIGNSTLYLDELQTLACRVEMALNSRPITQMSPDPSDLLPLTPGHFLVMRPLVAPPEPLYAEEEIPRLRRWQHVYAIFQSFWRRWQLEYLNTLQSRAKWTKDTPSLTVGTLVIIKEDNAPPLAWRMGRIVEVFPGKDQRVRVAKVRTATGEFLRPVHKLFPLPLRD